MKKLLLFLGCILGLGACKKQEVKDDTLIVDYLAENSLVATKTDEGLYYIITTEGTGLQPTVANTINITYEGLLLDGTIFDSGTIEYPLQQLIVGFQVGIPYFKKGGSGILLIPSGMAYGKQGAPPSVPKNAVLRFNITLNNVL